MSQDQYHRQIGLIYQRRAEQVAQDRERSKIGDDAERTPEPGAVTWHPRLPQRPDDFPDEADFVLSDEEASFLLDRIQRSHPSSLLAHLTLHCAPADVFAPWEHPDKAGFSSEHIELLDHARRFSVVMHGSALVYNIALAEEREWTDKADEHRETLRQWADGLNVAEVRDWSLASLWKLTLGHGHSISSDTPLRRAVG